MQPVVCADENHFDRQTRAYAEFRVFSQLTAERGSVASAVVTLQQSGTREREISCRIIAVTSNGDTVEATASGSHPYAAIDGAVADIAHALRLRRHVRSGAEHETA